MELKEALAAKAAPVEAALREYLTVREPAQLYRAMAHIPLAGGKRLRPVMALLACELVGGDSAKAVPYAAALETIHNFTLIHDDVMDEDELRHGVPSAHAEFGIATAINAGDALFAYAFEMVTDSDCSQEMRAELVRHVASTVREVAEGQQMDLDFEEREKVAPAEYLEMVRLKTSILFGSAAYGGARIGGASEEQARELRQMAIDVGLGFQIWDDYLDATVAERARRKYDERLELDGIADYDEILALLQKRDRIDSARKVSPLRIPDDAEYIDTNQVSAEQVAEMIIESLARNVGFAPARSLEHD